MLRRRAGRLPEEGHPGLSRPCPEGTGAAGPGVGAAPRGLVEAKALSPAGLGAGPRQVAPDAPTPSARGLTAVESAARITALN